MLAQTPKVRAFLTHGGISSLMESAYHGVPTVALPLKSDQLDNAARAEEIGISIMLRYRKHLQVDGVLDPSPEVITSDDVFDALQR